MHIQEAFTSVLLAGYEEGCRCICILLQSFSKNKNDCRSPAGLLQPFPVSLQAWEDTSLDFIDGLPYSAGKKNPLWIVDRLTRYAHFTALARPYSAKSVAELFVEHVVQLHGIPR